MTQPMKNPTVSREQAETIATELLEKARAVNPKIERAPVKWYWLMPCCTAGILAFLQGARADHYGTIAAGAGLCLIGIVMGMRPIGGFSGLMAKLSSIPPQTVGVGVLRLAAACAVAAVLLRYVYKGIVH
jgi:hypothetical protein